MQWYKAIRFGASLATALLVIAGFRFSGRPVNWLATITTFFISMFAMTWNNYIDRFVDLKKGRVLAYERPRLFLVFTLSIGIIGAGLASLQLYFNFQFGLLSFGMLIASYLYSFCQNNPYLKNFVVSVTIGSSVLFPALEQPSIELAVLFVLVCLLISGRENIKDIEDRDADLGHKRTFVTVFGVGRAAGMSGASLLLACVTLSGLSLACQLLLPLFLVAGLLLLSERRLDTAKTCLTAGLLGLIAVSLV